MRRIAIAPLCLLLACLCGAQARTGHRVVVEVNVPGTTAYATVLGNIENLKKAFAPEPVEVEVVCEGRGLDMLFSHDNVVAERVTKLHKAGVVFAACANTIKGRHIGKGRLLPFVQVVKAGVAEVVKKQEAGWSYLKGAF